MTDLSAGGGRITVGSLFTGIGGRAAAEQVAAVFLEREGTEVKSWADVLFEIGLPMARAANPGGDEMKVYLCGGMHNGWQDEAVRLLHGHVVLDPRSHGLKDEKAYTEWDSAAIREADAVLAYMDNDNPSGYGLNFEIGYATAMGKPVYLVMDNLGVKQKYFGMVRASSVLCASLDDAIGRLNAAR